MKEKYTCHRLKLVLFLAALLLAACAVEPGASPDSTASSAALASSSASSDSMTEDEREFEAYQKKLHDSDMENLMQMASTSDGAYSEAIFYELTERLFNDADATLLGLAQSAYIDDVMGATEEEKAQFLFAFGRYNVYDYAYSLGNEGDNEPSRTLRAKLEDITEDDGRYFIASNILDGWNHPETASSAA